MAYTNKEMMERMYEKLEKIEEKLSDTHELAKTTNGKVRFHTKLISSLGGALFVIAGWFVSHLIRSI